MVGKQEAIQKRGYGKFGRIGNGKSASVELFKILRPLGRKTRNAYK
jgi:hypothetical protein